EGNPIRPLRDNPAYEGLARYSLLGGADTNPTIIGVDVSSDTPSLYVILETGVKPAIKGGASAVSEITPEIRWTPPSKAGTNHEIFEAVYPLLQLPLTLEQSKMQIPPHLTSDQSHFDEATAEGAGGPEHQERAEFYKDITDIIYGKTASFNNIGNESLTAQEALGDRWHHVISSFEIKPCHATGDPDWENPDRDRFPPMFKFIKSTSKMWIALDDKNFTKFE